MQRQYGKAFDVRYASEAARELGISGSEYEQNEQMKVAALQYIISKPGQFIEQSADRFVRFWSLTPDSKSWQVNAAYAITTLPIFLGALAFAIFNWRDRRYWPMFLAILFFTTVHTVFHGLWRYRVPLDPLLMIMTAAAVNFWIGSIKERTMLPRDYTPPSPTKQ